MPHSAVTASNIKFSTLLLNEQTCVFPSKLITHLPGYYQAALFVSIAAYYCYCQQLQFLNHSILDG